MTDLKQSWVSSANDPDGLFPLNNLPYGVFSKPGETRRRCGVALGDQIIDLTQWESDGGLNALGLSAVFQSGCWNQFMALGPSHWRAFRQFLQTSFAAGAASKSLEAYLSANAEAQMHMPIQVSEFTDFYAGMHHATNVGTMFRGAENALPPNWLHIPIGYNGRASSVVISGTDVRRPWGQIKGKADEKPRWAPSGRFDLELEMGAIVGQPSSRPLSVDQAFDNIFGYVLLNDWSARDIQGWEYQPLGPFQAKATATSISPWIVTAQALEPFRCETPERIEELLPHLQDTSPMLYDIDLEVTLTPQNGKPTRITHTNYAEMYYSAAQQLAHHTTSGCPMRVGDLLGSGTISGPLRENRGSLLELCWGGKEPVILDGGEERRFIEDGDTLTLTGAAHGTGYNIGFGVCAGTVLPALDDPFKG